MTPCTPTSFCFSPPSRREVVARFDGGTITTDAGGLLLHRSEQKTGILRQFARCFLDDRQPERIDHSVPELVRQRVYGLALGYEDLNDHDQLRGDPLLAMLSGKADVEGRKRRRKRDRGKAGAGLVRGGLRPSRARRAAALLNGAQSGFRVQPSREAHRPRQGPGRAFVPNGFKNVSALPAQALPTLLRTKTAT